MPSPFDHVNHRVHDSGGASGNRSRRDAMMDEAARFSREIKTVMAEEGGKRKRVPIWKRILRRGDQQVAQEQVSPVVSDTTSAVPQETSRE